MNDEDVIKLTKWFHAQKDLYVNWVYNNRIFGNMRMHAGEALAERNALIHAFERVEMAINAVINKEELPMIIIDVGVLKNES